MPMTIKEMRERLTNAGVTSPSNAKKPELEALMKALDGVIVDEEKTWETSTPVDFVEKESVVLENKATEALPSEDRWTQMERIADRIAGSSLIAPPLRNKPEDILLVLLAAHDLGIPATQALSKLHVVDGKLAMSSEMMVALVLRDGHELWADDANDTEHQIVYGRRKGSDEVTRSEFTMADARTAGLADRPTWKKYPKAMLWARAVSGLCRQVFPDAVAGVSYTPDEIAPADGVMAVGEEGAGKSAALKQVAQPVRVPLSAETVELLNALSEGIKDLKEFAPPTADLLKQRWKKTGLPSLAKINTVDDATTATALFKAVIDEMPF